MKVNLVIDGNYILYRSVFSLNKTKTIFGDLERLLEISISNLTKKYPYNKIFLVSDSKETNWRKKVYPAYKQTRKKDETIDWEFCFNTYEQFKENLKSNNRIVLLENEGIEGDDWITHIVKKSNTDNISVVIVGSDNDLNQLLDFRLNPAWINIQYKDDSYKPKIYLPQNYKLFINELKKDSGDIFNLNDNYEFIDLIESMLEKISSEEIDKEYKLFIKIIKGDSGDNIKSVFHVFNKSGKKQGIGDSGANKIWESFKSDFPSDIDFNDNKWVDDIIPYVADYKKTTLTPTIEKEIKDNINLNRKLVYLDQTYLPKQIIDILNSKL